MQELELVRGNNGKLSYSMLNAWVSCIWNKLMAILLQHAVLWGPILTETQMTVCCVLREHTVLRKVPWRAKPAQRGPGQ